MKLIVTTKLLPTPEQAKVLFATMEQFNKACNWLAEKAFQERTRDKFRLQNLYYREIREEFGLSSQMTIHVIGKVCNAYKTNKKVQPIFKTHSAIAYDQRILSFKALDHISLLTIEGRLIIPFVVGNYFRARFEGKRGQSDLVLKKGKWYLYVTVEVPEEAPITPKDWLGVDLGVRNLAVDSDGDKHSGSKVKKTKERYDRLYSKLKPIKTKSAKKHLKKLAGKEKRFRADTNHTISKTLVSKAKDTGRGIALEDLKGINNRTTAKKGLGAMHPSWGFYQLRSFIEYKARLSGVPVAIVNPANTGITCPKCDYVNKRNRRSQAVFCCKSCGFSDHADHVGAINIARRAAVNQPIVVGTKAIKRTQTLKVRPMTSTTLKRVV